jgi:hypothetical protein
MTDEGLRYPLQWPAGRERTADGEREVSRFKYNLYGATEDMLDELERLGAEHPVISCNIRPRNKAGDLPSEYSVRTVRDPAVAVYFMLANEPHCFSCDRWTLVEDNIRAIGKTIEATRGITRWGSNKAMKQAMSGYKQLPPAGGEWRAVFGLTKSEPTYEVVKQRYRQLARGAHPDQGGRPADMVKLNEALAAAKVELGA